MRIEAAPLKNEFFKHAWALVSGQLIPMAPFEPLTSRQRPSISEMAPLSLCISITSLQPISAYFFRSGCFEGWFYNARGASAAINGSWSWRKFGMKALVRCFKNTTLALATHRCQQQFDTLLTDTIRCGFSKRGIGDDGVELLEPGHLVHAEGAVFRAGRDQYGLRG